jgi:outer membrane protein OmpA-like peptidoglycan-associated protein
VKKVGGAKAPLSSIEFQSSADLKLDDFDGADFSVAAVKGPKVSFGLAGSFESASSAFIEFRLNRIPNTVFSGTIDQLAELKPLEVPTLDEFKKKLTEPKIEVKMFEVSLGYGKLIFNMTDSSHNNIRPRLSKTERHDIKRMTSAYFEVDKDTPTASSPDVTSAQLELEVFLAIERALFDMGDGTLNVFGYASPEFTPEHNLDLSQRRANVILQAIKNAFGLTVKITEMKAIGLGEAPATDPNEGKLEDPPLQPSLEEWKLRHKDQVEQWKDWRRVDIAVEGQLVVRVRAEQP